MGIQNTEPLVNRQNEQREESLELNIYPEDMILATWVDGDELLEDLTLCQQVLAQVHLHVLGSHDLHHNYADYPMLR